MALEVDILGMMPKNRFLGKFIVFEGPDGSGQSTQAHLLKEYFEKNGRKVFLTKEPTQSTKAGQKIRRILDEEEKIAPLALQKLYVKDRAEHLKKEIIPALKQGKIVISDRYFFSTFAFGGLNVSIRKLIKLNEKFIFPDLVFLLKVRAEVCMRRIKARGKGFQFFEKLEKLKRILKNYEEVVKRFKEIKILNGEKKISEIHQQIIKICQKQF